MRTCEWPSGQHQKKEYTILFLLCMPIIVYLLLAENEYVLICLGDVVMYVLCTLLLHRYGIPANKFYLQKIFGGKF